jgi:hypothetical protein
MGMKRGWGAMGGHVFQPIILLEMFALVFKKRKN